jgi:hypothetical protein
MNNIRKIAGLLIVAVLIIAIGWGNKWLFIDSTSVQSESYSFATTTAKPIEPSSMPAPVPSPSKDISVSNPPKDAHAGTPALREAAQAVFPQPTSISSEVKLEAAPSKPSYEILKTEADAKILDLKNKAQSELLELVFQYQSVTEVKKKATLVAQGKTQMAGYDARFAVILSAFQAQLSKYGYDVAIIATYRQQYNQEKQIAQAFLGS